ncbi:MAG: GNAT family N-acetyltransferase, partial [Actinomycetota bacterium]|nr:GNAT family N-acetyltransferase [Actinomycetota bacterium]
MSSASDMTNDLRLRAATFDDVDTLTALLDAASQRWVGRPTSADEVRDRLATPHTAIDRDTVVALDRDESVVGFGHVWLAQPDEVRCFGRTHPHHRGKGVGTAVQGVLTARAMELARTTPTPDLTNLTTTTWPSDADGDVLLAGLGYQPARYFQKMVMDFAERQPDPLPDPAGLTLRGYEPADETEIFSAFVEAFADHWGEEHPDEETWWLDRRDGESAGYAPDLWLVAMDGDEIAGFVTAKVQEDSTGRSHGYVCDLGVRPRWRGRGLGECLLTRSLAMLRDRGLPYVALDV